MEDPVIAADGFTYDRAAMEKLFAADAGNASSPVTGKRFSAKELVPNLALRSLVHAFSGYAQLCDLRLLEALEDKVGQVRLGDGCGPSAVELLRDLEQELVCGITLDVMSDPAATADGQTYELRAISHWLRQSRSSPNTGVQLEDFNLTRNLQLRKIIVEFATYRRHCAMLLSWRQENYKRFDRVVASEPLFVDGALAVPEDSEGRVVCISGEHRSAVVSFDDTAFDVEVPLSGIEWITAGGFGDADAVVAVEDVSLLRGKEEISVKGGTRGVVERVDMGTQFLVVVRFAAVADNMPLSIDPRFLRRAIPGGFQEFDAVVATRDIPAGGQVVVRRGAEGVVISRASEETVRVKFDTEEGEERREVEASPGSLRRVLLGGFQRGDAVTFMRDMFASGRLSVLRGSEGMVVMEQTGCHRNHIRLAVAERPDKRLGDVCAWPSDVRRAIGGYRRWDSVAATETIRSGDAQAVALGREGVVVRACGTDRIEVNFDRSAEPIEVRPDQIRRLVGLQTGERVVAVMPVARGSKLAAARGAEGFVLRERVGGRVKVLFDSGKRALVGVERLRRGSARAYVEGVERIERVRRLSAQVRDGTGAYGQQRLGVIASRGGADVGVATLSGSGDAPPDAGGGPASANGTAFAASPCAVEARIHGVASPTADASEMIGWLAALRPPSAAGGAPDVGPSGGAP